MLPLMELNSTVCCYIYIYSVIATYIDNLCTQWEWELAINTVLH